MGLISPLLALFCIVLLYPLRWVFLGGITANIIETVLEDNLGSDFEVHTEHVGGSLFGGIEIDGLEISTSSSGSLQRIEFETLKISYRLIDILSLPPVSKAMGVSFHKNNMHTAWLFEDDLSAADAVRNLHSALPPGLLLSTSGSLLLSDERYEITADFAFNAGEMHVEKNKLADFEIFNVKIVKNGHPLALRADMDHLILYLTSEKNTVRLYTDSGETSGGIGLDALFRAEETVEGPELSHMSLELDVPGVSVEALAEREDASLKVKAADDAAAAAFLEHIIDVPSLNIGAFELKVSAEKADKSGSISLVSEFLSHPSNFYKAADIEAAISAGSWSFAPLSVSKLSAALEWQDNTFFAPSLTAEIMIPGLELTEKTGPQQIRITANDFSWRPFPNVFQTKRLSVDGGSGALEVDGSLKLTGRPVTFKQIKGDIAGRLRLGNPAGFFSALSSLLEIKDIPLVFGEKSKGLLQFSVKGRPSGFDGRVRFQCSDLRVADYKLDNTELEMRVTEEELVLDSLELSKGEGMISVDGRIHIPNFQLERYDFNVSSRNLDVWNPIVSNFSAKGNGTSSVVRISGFKVAFKPGNGPELSLVSPLQISWGEDGVMIGRFNLRSEFGQISGGGQIGRNSVSAELHAKGVPFSALWGLLYAENEFTASGHISIDAVFKGAVNEPDFSIAIEGNELLEEDKDSSLYLVVEQKNGIIQIRKLDVDLLPVGKITGAGSVPLSIGLNGIRTNKLETADLTIDAELFKPIRFFKSLKKMPFSHTDLKISISLHESGAKVKIAALNLSNKVDPVIIGVRPADSIILEAEAGPFSEFPVDLSAVLRSDKEELADISIKILAQSEEALKEDASLMPSGVKALIDLDVPLIHVSHLVPGVSLHGGRLKGTASIMLDEGGLSLGGTCSVSDAFIKIVSRVPTLSAMNAKIHLEKRSLVFEKLQTKLGPGILEGSGEIRFNQKGIPEIKADLSGTGLVFLRSPGLRAAGDADLSVSQKNGKTLISGGVEIRDVLYSQPIELFSLGKPAATPEDHFQLFRLDFAGADSVALDIRAAADGTINIDNNLYNGELSADIGISGTASLPLIEGRVFGDEGRMTLPTALLRIQQLEMVFPEDATLAPQIYVKAAADVQGYDMSVIVDGQIPSVEVSVASSPPLETDEALLLLTTGLNAGDLSFQGNADGTLTAAGAVLGRTIINQISDSLSAENTPFFERLDFTIDQDDSGSPFGALQVEYQLSKDERWFLLFERQAEEDYTIRLAWRIWAE